MPSGRVESVWFERAGTSVLADAPAGTTVISAGFPVDFDEAGGQLQHQPTGVVYDYATADPDADTITLAAPLPTGVGFSAGDALQVYPLVDDLYCHVRLDDAEADEEPIRARIPYSVRVVFPEGVRAPGTGEVVNVERNDDQEWIVQPDVPGSAPTVLGEFLQSQNYVAGSDGWRVDSDGGAEFNDITVRGTLETSPAGGKVVLAPNMPYSEIRLYNSANSQYHFIVDNGDDVSLQISSLSQAAKRGAVLLSSDGAFLGVVNDTDNTWINYLEVTDTAVNINGNPIGGNPADGKQSLFAQGTATSATTTSTSYINTIDGTNVPRVQWTATSDTILVAIAAWIAPGASDVRGWIAPRIYDDTVLAGILDAQDTRAVSSPTGASTRCGYTTMVTGLTPGHNYSADVWVKSSKSTGTSLNSLEITVVEL